MNNVGEMNPGLAALILSRLIEKAELDHPMHITGRQIDALTFAYSFLQDAANTDNGKEDKQ